MAVAFDSDHTRNLHFRLSVETIHKRRMGARIVRIDGFRGRVGRRGDRREKPSNIRRRRRIVRIDGFAVHDRVRHRRHDRVSEIAP